MNNKSKYNTKQRDILLGFLKSSRGRHVTVHDVCEYCGFRGERIGQTTIYRQLERMVDEGIVNKYIIDPNSPACFEYVGDSAHNTAGVCFHCKCEKCGKLTHLHCEELEEIKGHLAAAHGFSLDPFRTVFYGVCEDCAKSV